jgi:hypothetical protein
MSSRSITRRITAYVVGASVVLSALALGVGSARMGFGALVGGLVAVGNWLAMRWVAQRLVGGIDHAGPEAGDSSDSGESDSSEKGRAVWGALLALKMAALLALAWLILATGVVDPTGFSIGLSGLVVGALGGALHSASGRRTRDDGTSRPAPNTSARNTHVSDAPAQPASPHHVLLENDALTEEHS